MRLLHLFSNHKVTGPAEPAVRLAAHLARRGHDVIFAHAAPRRRNEGYMDTCAARYGLETTEQFLLPKHYRPVRMLRDARRMARFVKEQEIDLIHCNLVNDHVTATYAMWWARRRPRIVRTNHAAVPMLRGLRERWLFPTRTDALIEVSPSARLADASRLGMGHRTFFVETAIELARFDPGRELPDMRATWGLEPTHFVVGIAARIQMRRKFHILLDAAALVKKSVPNFRLAVIGRGTHMDRVAVRPARQRGLGDVAFFPGYLRDDEYVGGLAALDVKVFLFPGTDGSCRAAREAMAVGTPVVAARRGMLHELVTDEHDGLVVEDADAEHLADALIRLAEDGELRATLGRNARETALRRFDPEQQAEAVEQVYEAVMGDE
jgi:glycosyltransferase involved in cell wall biosynthesis